MKKEVEQGEIVEIEADHLLRLKQHIYGTFYGMEHPLLWKSIEHFADTFNKTEQEEAPIRIH